MATCLGCWRDRYEIVVAGKGRAYRLDRKTGEVQYIDRYEIVPVGEGRIYKLDRRTGEVLCINGEVARPVKLEKPIPPEVESSAWIYESLGLAPETADRGEGPKLRR